MIKVNIDAGELIPHKPPMQFIEVLTKVSDSGAETTSRIPADHIMVDHNAVPIYAAIEFMAQSIAAWSGYHDQQQGLKPGVGFLLGTRKLSFIQSTLPINTELVVRVERELEAENGLSSFNGQLFIDGAEIASARLNVFKPKNIES
ncbi:MAG: hypothetical protein HWD83_03525 [Gammaproteobacteria bacterium]|nr:hypothetical protein [Gammaproteobacteria bacterium]